MNWREIVLKSKLYMKFNCLWQRKTWNGLKTQKTRRKQAKTEGKRKTKVIDNVRIYTRELEMFCARIYTL